MKQSQKVLLGGIGVLAGVIVAMAGFARAALDQSGHLKNLPATGLADIEDLRGFTGVDARGSWEIQVTRGEDWQVKLNYPDDLEDSIRAYVHNERLILKVNGKGWGENRSGPGAEIVMPALNDLRIAGAGDAEVSGFNGDRFGVSVAGAVNLTGRDSRYDQLKLSAAGATEIDLKGVVVAHADVDIAGASSVILELDGGALTGTMAGAGSIEYYGDVSEQTVTVTGAGSVVHRN